VFPSTIIVTQQNNNDLFQKYNPPHGTHSFDIQQTEHEMSFNFFRNQKKQKRIESGAHAL
jgi:hypothetical protein